MKGYCFLILAVAFLMYFQKEPVFTVIILAIGIGLYLFMKARKSGKGFLGFLGGNASSRQDRTNVLVTLLLLQHLFSERESPSKTVLPKNITVSPDSEKDKIQKEIMALFEQHEASKKKVRSNKKNPQERSS